MPTVQGRTSNFTNAATPLTVSYPASIAATDLVVCAIAWRAGAANVLTPPTGYTLVGGSTTGSATTLSLWIGRLFGTGGGTAASFSTASSSAWGILRISGVDQTTPLDGSTTGSVGANTTTYAVAGQTTATVTAGALLLHMFAARLTTSAGATGAWTPDAATFEETDVSSSGATTSQAVLAWDSEAAAGAGTNTLRTATFVPSTGTPVINTQTAVLSVRAAAVASRQDRVRFPPMRQAVARSNFY